MGKLEGCLISSEQSLRRDSVTDLGTKGFKGTSSMSVVCSWLDSVFPVFQFCPLMARAVREASQRRTSTGPWLGRWVGCGGGGVGVWIWRPGRKQQEQRRGQGMRKEKALPGGSVFREGRWRSDRHVNQTGGWAKVQSSFPKPQGVSRASQHLLTVCWMAKCAGDASSGGRTCLKAHYSCCQVWDGCERSWSMGRKQGTWCR